MKLLFFKKPSAKVVVENLDDLWYLNSIIDVQDVVEGKTERKIKIGEASDRAQKIIRKWVFLKIAVEKVEFHPYSSVLRVSGKIIEGTDDIPKGSYHTFNIEPDSAITITKSVWLKFQNDKLKEACEKPPPNILICVFDREEAFIALLKRQGFELLTILKGSVAKKSEPKQAGSNFYSEIITQLKEYAQRYLL